MADFEGKAVLVTGSSSGIGAATAIAFAQQGAWVTISGRKADALQKIAEAIQAISGKDALQIVGDIADESIQKQLIDETVSKFGRLDVLVNNAGMGNGTDHIEHPDVVSGYDQVFAVNVRAPLRLMHLAAPHLIESKGNIINISSVAAINPMLPVYCASKAALDMMTKSTALQLAPKGVRVNNVNPGPVATGLLRGVGIEDEGVTKKLFDKYAEYTPLKRVAIPNDISNLIVFLATERLSKNITGSSFVSDSGALLDPSSIHKPINELQSMLS